MATIKVKFSDDITSDVEAIETPEGLTPNPRGYEEFHFFKTRAGEWCANTTFSDEEPDEDGEFDEY
jgi:hypothetical protein